MYLNIFDILYEMILYICEFKWTKKTSLQLNICKYNMLGLSVKLNKVLPKFSSIYISEF